MEKSEQKTGKEDLELKIQLGETNSELIEKLEKIVEKELEKK